MNALLHEVVEHGRIDKDYVAAHTLRYDELVATVAAYPGLAAEIFGASDRVLSTVLQGLYQSHQATSASCQVNNLQLLRGMIGRPGVWSAADERPADRREHPRVRCRRRPSRIPELGEP